MGRESRHGGVSPFGLQPHCGFGPLFGDDVTAPTRLAFPWQTRHLPAGAARLVLLLSHTRPSRHWSSARRCRERERAVCGTRSAALALLIAPHNFRRSTRPRTMYTLGQEPGAGLLQVREGASY